MIKVRISKWVRDLGRSVGRFLDCLAHFKKEGGLDVIFSFFSIYIHVYDYMDLIYGKSNEYSMNEYL